MSAGVESFVRTRDQEDAMPMRVEAALSSLWKPALWLALSAAILAVDYASGPVIQFQMLFVIPVGLAAWLNGRRWGSRWRLHCLSPVSTLRQCWILPGP